MNSNVLFFNNWCTFQCHTKFKMLRYVQSSHFFSHFFVCFPFWVFFIFQFFVFIDHVNFFINLLLALLVDCHFESLPFFQNHPLPNFHLKYLTLYLLQLLTFAHCFIEIFFYFSLLLIGDESAQAHLVCVFFFANGITSTLIVIVVLKNRQYCIHCKIISNDHWKFIGKYKVFPSHV